jgi:ferredoxin-NADP reductase
VFVYNILTGQTYTTDLFGWWVANPVLFWPTLIFGLLVVSKIRRWALVGSFIITGLLMFLFEEFRFGVASPDSVVRYFVSYPTLFLAFFMLTEPFTMPPRTYQQVMYGALVGALSSTALFAPVIAMTPELALVLGNGFAYLFRVKRKLFPTLQEKREIAPHTWEFIFTKPTGFAFEAGQYAEWMLPHKNVDSRGPRRYFTIAASPTEPVVRLACKIISPESGVRGSTYKQALRELDQGAEIIVSQIAGDFVLPRDTNTKLGFIAGGIGITPFVSHLLWMKDSGQHFNTHLYYCCNTLSELAYRDELKKMQQILPLVLIPVIGQESVTPPNEQGFVTAEMLARRTPDFKQRMWYISGPPGMVNAYTKLLYNAGVPKKNIHTDFFPGLA